MTRMQKQFAAVDHESMGDLVYNSLSDALIAGTLRPNDRLRIRELADQMGTSVTPVRDAILRLVQDGALVAKTPRDIRVETLTRQQYIEIRTIRLELEGLAAAAAASKATTSDLEELERLVSLNEEAIKDREYAEAIGLNQAFHFKLVSIADMPVLLDILRRLWLKMGPLISEAYEPAGRVMIDHHYPLLEAVRNRDGVAAKLAIQNDIMQGGQSVLKYTAQ